MRGSHGLIRKLALEVAPVSGPAVMEALTRPAAMCGPGDRRYSRPGGRRYLFTDRFYVVVM